MKGNHGAGDGSITWGTRREPKIGRPHLVGFVVQKTDSFQTVAVDFEADSPLTVLRLDPGTRPGTVSIASLRLVDSTGKVLKDWLVSGGK